MAERFGDEQAQVLEWLYATLVADQELADLAEVPLEGLADRVWPDVAPPGTLSPWLVYSAGEAMDVNPVGSAPRVHVTVPLNVRWVQETDDPGAGAPAQRRLYALLHGVTNAPVPGGGTILTCRRYAVLNYPEDAGGVAYRHTGGLFTAEVN